MKKVLILSSSPRKLGNSDLLCERFAEGAREGGNEVEKLRLRDYKIDYCTGCGACESGARPCVQRDDAAAIVTKMKAADVIVLATPVYFYAMSGQLKTMIDRCCSGYTEMQGQDFYLILTAADTDEAAMAPAVAEYGGFLSCLDGAKDCGVLYGLGVHAVGEVKNTKAYQEAYRLGKKC